MLHQARDGEGRDHWLWRAEAAWLDLSQAGLAPELSRAATWLASGADGRAALLKRAPALPADPDQLGWTLRAPGRPGKILALGRNFAAHAREMGAEPSLDDMLWFAKLPDCLTGPGAEVQVPDWLPGRVDPEAELVLLLGADLRDADAEACGAAIAAWSLGNDLTARTVQGGDKERGWPWLRGKNVAGFCALGPGWLPADALAGWDGWRLQGWVGAELRQEADLADMLYRPARALAELSRWLPLRAGDAVYLGTPAGVAPLQHGDVARVTLVDGAGAQPLGELVNRIVRPVQPD